MSEHSRAQPGAYRRYLVGLLMVLAALNFTERFALGVVLQDIKAELVLTDTQLGLLTGIAFALFYSLMGLPIAHWADRGNRAIVISLTAGLWGLAVAACGIAQNFTQLLLVRVGVAVGEAGGFVPGSSLIADYFSRTERPRAIAIYSLASSLSLILGYWVAGWLNESYGWRVMFVLLGAPGVILGILARITIKEPRIESRGPTLSCVSPSSEPSNRPSGRLSLREVCVHIVRIPTFRQLVLCTSVMFFFSYGILQWQPSFFIRSHGFTTSEVGAWFAASYGVGGFLGTYAGGVWASRYAANREALQLKVIAVAMAACTALSAFIYLSSNAYLALLAMSCVMFALGASNGPVTATLQTLVPVRMRAVALAIMLLCANLIGLGLGPLAAGVLSDALRESAGDESLRYALLAFAPGYVWAAWHLWRASRTVSADIAAASKERDETTLGAAAVSVTSPT